jgi:hypothetical protein
LEHDYDSIINIKNYNIAALYGTVSAAYIIEQEGLPKLSRANSEEIWNGDSPRIRLENIRERSKMNADIIVRH